MAHPRKLIRHAVVALLIAASTAAGARVKPTRVEPNKKGELPAIGVYTLNDPVEPDDSTELERVHELELEITGWVGHTDANPADDRMDDLAEQIENAMIADAWLSGTASEVRLIGSTMQVVEENGRTDPHVGVIVLTYAVKYRKSLAALATDDFRTVDAKVQVVGGIEDDTPLVENTFTVQEPPP